MAFEGDLFRDPLIGHDHATGPAWATWPSTREASKAPPGVTRSAENWKSRKVTLPWCKIFEPLLMAREALREQLIK